MKNIKKKTHAESEPIKKETSVKRKKKSTAVTARKKAGSAEGVTTVKIKTKSNNVNAPVKGKAKLAAGSGLEKKKIKSVKKKAKKEEATFIDNLEKSLTSVGKYMREKIKKIEKDIKKH